MTEAVKKKRRALGRNLNALLGDLNAPAEKIKTPKTSVKTQTTPTEAVSEKTASADTLQNLSVKFLQSGKYQPRTTFDDESLQALSESIRSQGIIQPITVRALAGKNSYEIIAGERRWRAAKLAGLTEVPVIIRDVDDETTLALAVIENIQRENLNPLEEALALSTLHKEFQLTHQLIAKAVGKSRTAVTNFLRLLTLPEAVQTMLRHGDLEMGHARAILALPTTRQLSAARNIVERACSVRDAEQLVRDMLRKTDSKTSTTANPQDATLLARQKNLSKTLGTPVRIQQQASGKGKVTIPFKTVEQMERLLALLESPH